MRNKEIEHTTVEDFPIIGTRLVDSQTISGVVFKCDVSSCYIMSVREGSSLKWMNTIKAKNSDLSKYPAFKWCADYGADWYLPAQNELIGIYSNNSKLNTALSNAGGTTLETSSYYWSSTEYNSYYAYIVSFSNGYSSYNGYYKSNSYRVRAVRAL